MTILLTGAKGQLGTEFLKLAPGFGFKVLPVDFAELDISNSTAVQDAFRANDFSCVVNAAAYTAVDKAETDSARAFAANQEGPSLLTEASRAKNIPLIHISTDYIFDGTKAGAYLESDRPNPQSVYGASKEAGEREVRSHNPKHLIFRTSWVYSAHGNNFVKTILKLSRERSLLKVIDDQKGAPTAAGDLAEVIAQIVQRYLHGQAITWGTYHYTGAGLTSWHGFASTIVEQARPFEVLKVEKIEAIPTEAYPLPAKRPKNSALCCELFERSFSIQTRPWRESLKNVIKELYA